MKRSRAKKEIKTHFNKQLEALEAAGYSYSGSADDYELNVCWFDKDDKRNSMSFWLDDFTGYWSSVKGGKTLEEKYFDTSEDFLQWNV